MSYHLDMAYEEIVKKLSKKDQKALEGFVRSFPPDNKTKLDALLACGINIGKTEELVKSTIEGFMAKKKKHKWGGKQGKEFSRFLKKHELQLNDEIKKKVIKWLDDSTLGRYHSYAQKDLVSVVSGWITDESEAINQLNKYYSKLDREATLHLLDQITSGEDHPELKKFREKSVQLVIEKLLSLDLDKKDERETFIKEIAKRPSIVEKVGKNIVLTEADLNVIPPARRLDFLEYVYRPIFRRMWLQRNKSYHPPPKIAVERFKENRKISLKIRRDKMKNILFSVSLRKNDQVQVWWDKYQIVENMK